MNAETLIKIEIRDLTMAYGSFVVMRDINAQIKRGEIFIIMGGSGCVLLIIYIGTLFASDEVDSSKSLSFFLLSMALNIQVRQFQSIFMGMDVNLRVK